MESSFKPATLKWGSDIIEIIPLTFSMFYTKIGVKLICELCCHLRLERGPDCHTVDVLRGQRGQEPGGGQEGDAGDVNRF